MRPGRAADHSPPSSAAVMEEYSYTSTHPLGHTGIIFHLYIYIHTHTHKIVNLHLILQSVSDLRFPLRCKCDMRCCGMLRSVNW